MSLSWGMPRVPHSQVKLYLSQRPVAHLCPLVAFLVTTGSALEPGAQGHAGRLQPLCQVFQNCVNLEWVGLSGQRADGGPLRCSWPLPLTLCLCDPPERLGPTQEEPLVTKCLYILSFMNEFI